MEHVHYFEFAASNNEAENEALPLGLNTFSESGARLLFLFYEL